LSQISGQAVEPDTEPDQGDLVQQEILGVDFGSALKMHDHDEALLLSLMDEFVRIYSNADKDFLDLLKEKELEKAERLMHNMAGVVGNFGANQLMKTSRVLEHEFVHGNVPEPADVEDFSRELSNFVKAIGQYQSAL
jgi:HPt (histidine-containing phosphotransfer) domain-containing protein